MSISVSVPSTRHVEPGGYTTYQVRVICGMTNHVIAKRYSEFFDLHKKLRRIVRPYPEFPSKRLVKKSDPKVVQYRRKGLEIYIQGLVEVLPVHQLVLEFLQLGDVSEEYDEIDYEEFASLRKSPARYTHFPVLRMCSYQPQRDASCDMKFEEPGFSDASTSAAAIEDAKSDVDLGDIVTKGVVWGLRNKAS